jgi:CBS domain-containing protein
MRVQELMVRDVAVCSPETDLARAARIMWERDCGALPVVVDQKVVGIITDRDIAMSVATKERPAREIQVREVVNGPAFAVHPNDDIARALELMAEKQVRRVPVVDAEQRLHGILSASDIILAADKVRGSGADDLSYMDAMGVLKAISRRRIGRRQEPRGGVSEAKAARKRISAAGA